MNEIDFALQDISNYIRINGGDAFAKFSQELTTIGKESYIDGKSTKLTTLFNKTLKPKENNIQTDDVVILVSNTVFSVMILRKIADMREELLIEKDSEIDAKAAAEADTARQIAEAKEETNQECDARIQMQAEELNAKSSKYEGQVSTIINLLNRPQSEMGKTSHGGSFRHKRHKRNRTRVRHLEHPKLLS